MTIKFSEDELAFFGGQTSEAIPKDCFAVSDLAEQLNVSTSTARLKVRSGEKAGKIEQVGTVSVRRSNGSASRVPYYRMKKK